MQYQGVNLLKAANVEFTYDTDGFITNKAEVLDAISAYIRANYDDAAAKEVADSLTENLNSYTSLLQESLEASDRAEEYANEQLKNNAKIIQQVIDNRNKVKDLKLAYEDF
jgi:hypothetical protein